jgi:histidine triad (HIT) family protein
MSKREQNFVSQTGTDAGLKTSPPQKLPADIDPCLFCRIVAKEVPASIVFEDDISIAFLDTRPLFPGHSLLIPRVHYQTLADIPLALVGPLFSNAQHLARGIQDVMQAEGTFVGINNTVSQSVLHFHIHIVPRRKGDGLKGFFWPRRAYQGDEMSIVHQSLTSRLRQ